MKGSLGQRGTCEIIDTSALKHVPTSGKRGDSVSWIFRGSYMKPMEEDGFTSSQSQVFVFNLLLLGSQKHL